MRIIFPSKRVIPKSLKVSWLGKFFLHKSHRSSRKSCKFPKPSFGLKNQVPTQQQNLQPPQMISPNPMLWISHIQKRKLQAQKKTPPLRGLKNFGPESSRQTMFSPIFRSVGTICFFFSKIQTCFFTTNLPPWLRTALDWELPPFFHKKNPQNMLTPWSTNPLFCDASRWGPAATTAEVMKIFAPEKNDGKGW